MIGVSVLLPFFRAKYIGWLPMEGLIRQVDIDFEWELIVAEELNDETFGKNRISEYMPKLKQIGCIRFKYIGLPEWIPLSGKRKLLIDESDLNSKLIMGNGSDDYSPPKRLSTMWKLKQKHPDADWFSSTANINYDIATDIALQRKPVFMAGQTQEAKDFLKKTRADVAGQAQAASLMRKVAKVINPDLSYAVDGHVWKTAHRIKPGLKLIIDEGDNWKYSLNTNGFNNISFEYRDLHFKNPTTFPGHDPTPINMDKFIPPEIMKRLRDSKKFLHLHKRGLPA